MARSVPSTDRYDEIDGPVLDLGNDTEQGQVAILSLPAREPF